MRRGNPLSSAVAWGKSRQCLCSRRDDCIPVQLDHSGLTGCCKEPILYLQIPVQHLLPALPFAFPIPAPNLAFSTLVHICTYSFHTLRHRLNTYLTSKMMASPGSYTMFSNSWKPSVQRGLARQVDRS